MTRVLFQAPLKPPDHPEPSGDRTMARLLVSALREAGYEVEVGSRLRMLDRRGDAELMRDLAARARGEAEALARDIAARRPEDRPGLVFSYHVFYKAPDVVGPCLARLLGLPYAVAEGSRAPRRAQGPWSEGHRLAEEALDAADCVFVLNPRDRPALEAARPPGQRLVDLPPFLDTRDWPEPPGRVAKAGPTRLLAVAMMRPGDKLASYRALASSLSLLQGRPWTLAIAGDGPARGDVDTLFEPFGERIHMLGRLDEAALRAAYAEADLLVWPAVNEAFGMVFLEAGAMGCPALAGRVGGVPGVVRDGETGILVAPDDPSTFAAALARCLDTPDLLHRLGRHAARFVRNERTLAGAAGVIGRALAPLAARRRSEAAR